MTLTRRETLLHSLRSAVRIGAGIGLLLALVTGVSLQSRAQTVEHKDADRPPTFSSEQTAAIERIVREFLVSRPEVLLEAQQSLEAKLERDRSDRVDKAIAANARALFDRGTAATLGDPSGDVTVVEFYDYNCPYCRRASAAVREVLERDKKIRVVVQELPILSKGSEEAARIALAAGMQGRYELAHAAIGAARGPIGDAAALKAVASLGLDMQRLKQDISSDAVTAELELVQNLAKQLLIEGTPYFIVGDKIIPGAPDNLAEALKSAVDEVRTKGCRSCKP